MVQPSALSARNLHAKSWLSMSWPRKGVPCSILEFEPSIARAEQRHLASFGDVFWSKTGKVDVRDVRIWVGFAQIKENAKRGFNCCKSG